MRFFEYCLATLILALPIKAAPAISASVPVAGVGNLAPGQYYWHPEIASSGPVVVVVSLDEQRAHVYRNGLAIGLSTISSGRKGHETPTGIFTILQRETAHYSNLYDDAPMPYMERLTWSGIAMHGGTLPGYPASHGCIRLPHAFAEKLFTVTRRGQTVVIANANVAPTEVVYPGLLAPITPVGERMPPPWTDQAYFWDATRAPDGPVSILIGLRDRRVFVLRNGILIGSANLAVNPGFEMQGTLLLVATEGFDTTISPVVAGLPRHRWSVYSIAGVDPAVTIDTLAANLHVNNEFARHVYSILEPGSTIVLTDVPAVREPDASYSMELILESVPASTKVKQ